MPGNIISLTPETIANWPTPNYVNPPERSWMPIYAGILYGVATLMVGLRIWLRVIKQAGGLGLDDLLLVVAWIASSMNTVVLILSTVVYHVGRDAWNVPLFYFEKIALMSWLAQFAFLLCGGATKISVLLFYRRLVAGTYTRKWKCLVLMAIAFTAGWTIAFILTLIFNCSPTEAYWKAFNPMYMKEYKCVNTVAVNLLAGIFAVFSDLYAVVLPCLMARSFELPRRQKIALNLVFSLGVLVVGASIARTHYLWQVGHASDVTYTIFNVFIWAQLELQLGIICASLPALRVFLRKYLVATFARATHSGIDMGQSRKGSVVAPGSIKAMEDPLSPFHADFDDKQYHARQRSIEETTVADMDFQSWSPSTTAPSEAYLIKPLKEYESNDMQLMEKRSIHAPSFERSASRGRTNFSQPLPKSHTTFYDGR